jgi:tetratricopeptide (TPR) repeat protein
MNKQKRQLLFFLLICFSTICSNSRVAFSRPGSLIRLPSFESYNSNHLFSIGLSSEITSLGDVSSNSSAFSITKTNINNISWGFSYTLPPYTGINPDDKASGYELGFHYQQKIYSVGQTNVIVGAHDFIVTDSKSIDLYNLSLFVNFSNSAKIGDYTLISMIGAGAGKLYRDPHEAPEDEYGNEIKSPLGSLGVYAAIKLKTPFLNKWGGVNLITEFSNGMNMGLSIPVTEEYELSFGITHLENLSDFSVQSVNSVGETAENLGEYSPGISFGLKINLPKIKSSNRSTISQQNFPVLFINGTIDSSLYNAGEYIYFLQDSLEILKQQVNNISATNVKLRLDNNNYQDSLNNLIFSSNINLTNQNAAMRHLSKSLRLYYQGDFTQALEAVEKAILLQPNTAMAYARKGSIYYKLNQLDRATLNWNIALKLDPEYQEVREMLNALKNNKLRPLSSGQ